MGREAAIAVGCLAYVLSACASADEPNANGTQTGPIQPTAPGTQPGGTGMQGTMPGMVGAPSSPAAGQSTGMTPPSGGQSMMMGTAGVGNSGGSGTAGQGGGQSMMMGTAGVAGTPPVAGTGGEDPPPQGSAPPCLSDMHQLGIIGDSYIDWVSHSFPTDLAELGGGTGVWNAIPGRGGTMYAVGGTAILTGDIPGQLDRLLNDHAGLKVIVMDGGGNDVLLNPAAQQCKATGSSRDATCQRIVTDTLAASEQMYNKAADAGVRDIVFFFYPEVPNGTLLGGPNPNEISEYARPMVAEACAGTEAKTGGRLRCHFVDMVPVFAGHSDYFAPLDLHPNFQGSAAMAEAVWTKMVEQCIGQQASSGCCTP
jgi:hypothetical protein